MIVWQVEGMDDMMKAKLDAVLADTLRKQAEELTEVTITRWYS